VIHTRDNNGGITVDLVSGRIKVQTQTSIVGPSRVRQSMDNWVEMNSLLTNSEPADIK